MTTPLTKARDRFTETEIDDETVVMCLESGDFFSLTGTARSIWHQLDVGHDRAGLIAAVADEYGVTAESVAADVEAFLADLAAAGLLAGQ